MSDVDMKWHGDRVKALIRAGQLEGLDLAAEHLLQVSQNLVPIETAVLQDSGTTSVDAAKMKSAVAFDTPYAVIQHEDPDFEHDEGRQANYLGQPMATEAPVIRAILAKAVKKKIGT